MDPSFDAVCAFNESEVIFVHPRRKTGESKGRRHRRDAVMVSIETLQPLFGFTLSEAAKAMGICDTALKSCCRRLGISRWPSESNGRTFNTSPIVRSPPTTVGSHLSLEMIFSKQTESAETVGDANRSSNRLPSGDPDFKFQEPLQEQDLYQQLSTNNQQDEPRFSEEVQQVLRHECVTVSYGDVLAENLPVSDLQNLKDTPWRLDFPLMAAEVREIDHCHDESFVSYAPYSSSLYGHLPWEKTAVCVC